MTEIEFPAVTICSQGLNMENVARAVERDFYNWHTQQQAQQVKWSKKKICCDKLFQNEGGRNKRDQHRRSAVRIKEEELLLPRLKYKQEPLKAVENHLE